ncbi:MAG: DUF1697 domain-containing protein [Anaerolineae bacterium]|nr:DUF1697 domain-containing protein [Anaerolineae bacterium]
MPAKRYIGLLRGINVGGNKKVPMADLREMMVSLGFENVKTVLASGNVAWDADSDDTDAMQSRIEAAIQSKFGFNVPTQVIPQTQVEALITRDPFAGIEVTADTRLYVTFLPQAHSPSFEVPYHAPTGDFTILSVAPTDVCSVLTVSNTRSIDAMAILETEFGKGITTRNWNTVLKIAKL